MVVWVVAPAGGGVVRVPLRHKLRHQRRLPLPLLLLTPPPLLRLALPLLLLALALLLLLEATLGLLAPLLQLRTLRKAQADAGVKASTEPTKDA